VQASQPQANSGPDKNSGRKLSMTVPGLGTANITVTTAEPKGLNISKPLAPGKHVKMASLRAPVANALVTSNKNNITVRVPASVDEAIEDAQVFTRHLGRSANNGYQGASRFVAMIAQYIRQWTGAAGPAITPASSPYVQQSSFSGPLPATTVASGHKIYYTAEGRLKSVVDR
jgi:hypothetical protein